MILRTLTIMALLVLAAALQTAVLPVVSVGGFRPDLLLLLVIAFAVLDGPEAGVRIGFVAGLLTDLLLATSAIGVGALTMAVVGYAVGTARPYLAPNSSTAPLLLCFAGSVVGSLLLGTLSSVLGDAAASPDLLLTVALFVGVVHTVLMIPVLSLTRAVSERFPAEGASGVR